MAIAIKVEGLSKAYQLGQIGTGTISRDLERWVAKLRGKEDPFLKIGETNDRTTISKSNVVWSLKDINFEIQQGDAVGIIGRNGAGKSTLLKLLSRVTSPTTGIIKAKGRIASLLEVGTGFHPELTGRENIYLNGAILGMRKKEIDKKFDEIVDFSGIEKYVDTPVKRYSSGMYVRLAFAVAAHLESEILIVDEVLAVGDAEFQKKCLGKMGEVSKNEGRTVLFVSHNMAATSSLCSQAILLKNGQIEMHDQIYSVVEYYMKQAENNNSNSEFIAVDNILKSVYIKQVSILNKEGKNISQFSLDDSIFMKINIETIGKFTDAISIGIAITDKYERRVLIDLYENHRIDSVGYCGFLIEIPGNTLTPGEYFIQIGLTIMKTGETLDFIDGDVSFEINKENTRFEKLTYDYGIINQKFIWKEG